VALLPNLKVSKVFPGAKRFPRHFDAVVIYHNDANEVNFIKDEVERYKDAPNKAFIGSVAYDRAGDYHAAAFTHDQAAELLNHLQTQNAQLEEVIRKAFTLFDKDNSGSIEINELQEVSKELGRAMDQAELEECLQDLDQNKDGKISYDEFRKWWLSGRQGLSPWMRRLLAFKIKTNKFFGTIQGTLGEVIGDATQGQIDIATNTLSVNLNTVEHAGTTISAKVLILSNEVKQLFVGLKALHSFQENEGENPLLGNITIEVRDGKANEAREKFE
jgi:hypothetical protein